MKILLSFVFSLTLIVGVSAQVTPVNQIATVNFTVPDADRGIEIPDCLLERIFKELGVEDFTVEYLYTIAGGLRIYRYELGPTEFGYISLSNLSCLADIVIADDPNDLFIKPISD